MSLGFSTRRRQYALLAILLACSLYNSSRMMSPCDNEAFSELTSFAEKEIQGLQCFKQIQTTLNVSPIAQRTKDELISLFNRLSVATFYSLDAKAALTATKLLSLLKSRGFTYPVLNQRALRNLLATRRFKEAKAFATEYSIKTQIPTEVADVRIQARKTLAYSLDSATLQLNLEAINLGKELTVVVIASPGCHFSLNAIRGISDSSDLSDLFSRHGFFMAGQYENDIPEIASWNLVHPNFPLHLVYQQRDWPDIDTWGFPTFYVFDEGKLIHKWKGWTNITKKNLLALQKTLTAG